jgi:hypothetical protein
VGRRQLLVGLVAAAPLADAAGAASLAFWALVAAVPFAAACALDSFGSYLEAREDAVRSLQALLWAPVLLLLLAAAVARGPALELGAVPRLGVTAVVGCLAVLGLKAAVAACSVLYRGKVRPSSISLAPGVDASGFRSPVAAKPARS